MGTITLYLHRVEAVEKNGKVALEKIPENKDNENCGVKYRVEIIKIDRCNAVAYGWEDWLPWWRWLRWCKRKGLRTQWIQRRKIGLC